MSQSKLEILEVIVEIAKELYELIERSSEINDTIYELERDIYKGSRSHILSQASMYVPKQVNLNYLKDMQESIKSEVSRLEDELDKAVNESYKK